MDGRRRRDGPQARRRRVTSWLLRSLGELPLIGVIAGKVTAGADHATERAGNRRPERDGRPRSRTTRSTSSPAFESVLLAVPTRGRSRPCLLVPALVARQEPIAVLVGRLDLLQAGRS